MTWMCHCGAAHPCEKCSQLVAANVFVPPTPPLIAGKTREQWRWEFAGMAMQGMLGADWQPPGDCTYASVAVFQADALIAALEGKP